MSVLDETLDSLMLEVERQDEEHPAAYLTTRDGVRLGIAALEDEVRESLAAWDAEKRGNGAWPMTYAEVEQVAAVAVRLLRSMRVAGTSR